MALLGLVFLPAPARALGEIRLVGATDTPGASYIDVTIPPGESQPIELWIESDASINGFAVYMIYDGQGIRLEDTADTGDSFPAASPLRQADEDHTVFGDIIRNEGTWSNAPTDTFLYAALTSADSFIGSARAAILTFTAIDTGTWTIRFQYDTSNNLLTAMTLAETNGTNVLTLEDTGVVQSLYPDTPVIRFLSFASDTSYRFFDAAPFDTTAAGDTVWFAAETQTVTLTVTFTSTSPDSIHVTAVFDSGAQVDSGAPYTAIFAITPAHATGETTTVLTAFSASGSLDTLLIRFRPDTTAPDTVTPISPVNGTVAETPTFLWTPSTDSGSGVRDYIVQVSDSSSFATILASETTPHPDTDLALATPLTNGLRYWRVIAVDSVGNATTAGLRADTFLRSDDVTAPETFALTAPTNGTETNATSITFRWSDAADSSPPVSYRLLVDTDMAGAYVGDTTLVETFVTLTLPANETYSWRVIATDLVGETRLVGDSTLVIDTTPPSAATLLVPAVDHETRVTSILFSWNAASDSLSGVAGYRIQFDTAPGFGAVLFDSSVGAGTSALRDLPANETWYWRVLTLDDAGNSTNSETRLLIVDTAPPSAPAAIYPTAAAETNALLVGFAWTASVDTLAGVANYRLQVDTAGVFTGALAIDSTLTATETSVTLPNGAWSWRVIAIDDAGNTTTISPIAFTVDRTAPFLLTAAIVSSVSTHFTDSGGIDTTAASDTVFFNNGGAGASQTCTVTVTMSGGVSIVFPALFGDTGASDTETPYQHVYTLTEGFGDTVMVLVARDTAGNEDSITINWIRDTVPSPPASLLAPINGQTIGDTTPTLTWTASADTGAGTKGYVIELSDSTAFATIVESSFVTTTSYTSTGLSDSIWYWRVIPYDTVANADTGAATIRSFTVDSGVPVISSIEIVSSVDTRFYADSPVTPGPIADTVWFNPTGLDQTCTITVFVQDTNESYVTGSAAFVVVQGSDTGLNQDSYTLVYRIPADSPSALITIEVTDEAGFMDTALVQFEADTTPPTTAAPTTPADGAETNATSIAFSWSAASDTGSGFAGYRLQADTDPAFSAPAHDSPTSITSGALTLDANDTWYWRIVSTDRVGNETFGASFRLTVDTTPPVPGTLLAPTNGAETNATAIAFSWNAAFDSHTGVLGYQLQADTDPAFGAPAHDSATTATSGALTLAANDTWYWRVLVTDSAGNTAASESRGLIIDTTPPTPGSLLTPTDLYDTNVTTIVFTWGAAADSLAGVASYRLQVDTVNLFIALVGDSVTTSLTETLVLPANDTYFWRVLVTDSAGNTETYTPARRLRIDTAPPDSPILVTRNGDTLPPTVTLVWGAATDSLTGLAAYVIQIDTNGTFLSIVESATLAPNDTDHLVTTSTIDTYFWRVLAYDTVGNVAVSNPVFDSFLLIAGDTRPPDSFTLTSPADGTGTNAVSITLRWQDAADSSPPVTYRVQVDTAGAFTASWTDTFWLSETFVTLTFPANETHSWRVIARDAAGNTETSTATWRIIVDTEAPFGSALTAPASPTETNVTTIAFAWSAASDSLIGVAGYRLQADTAGTFATLLIDSPTTALAETLTLPANDTYFWRVVMLDSVGNQASTESRVLRLDTTSPVPGTLIAPTNGAETNATAIAFSWNAAFDSHTGVLGYQLQADTDPAFGAPAHDSATTATSGALTLAANDTWYWRVLVTDSAGNTAASESRGLIIDTDAPTPGSLLTPTDLFDTNVTTIVFTWSAAADSLAGVASYRLQVDTVNLFIALVGDSVTTALTETLVLPANDTYFWRVLVTDSAGNTETYTPARRLRIDTAPPDSPILVTRNGDTLTPTVTLVWGAATDSLTGLAAYVIQIDTNGTFLSIVESATLAPNDTDHLVTTSTIDTYFWRVLAYDTVGNVAVSNPVFDSFLLLTGDTLPPDSFTLTAPADGTGTNAVSITLRWQDADDSSTPVTYRVQVDTAGAFAAPWTDTFWLSETFVTLTFPANETHSWRVIARDAAGNTETSTATWRIIVDTMPPDTPMLTTHGGDSIEVPATLRWTAATDSLAGIAYYIVQIDTAGTFAATFETGVTFGADTDYVTSSLTPGIWYWRVIVVDSAGNSTSAAADSFQAKTADSTPPTVFSLTSPANGTLTDSTLLTFRWGTSTDAVSSPVTYRLQLDTAGTFVAPVVDTGWLSETYATVVVPANDTYRWRVIARDNALTPNLRQSSETWTLVIDTAPPSSPVLAAFAGATRVTPLQLSWTAPSDSIAGVAFVRVFVTPDSTDLAPTVTDSWTGVLPAGTYYWAVTAYDTLGNAATSTPALDSFVVVNDTTAPSADSAVAPTLDNAAPGSCTVPIYITDDAVVETVFVNLLVLGGTESTAAVPNTPPPSTDSLWVVTIPVDSTVSGGTYNLIVTYIDASGNTGTTTITITITDNSPSEALILDTPLAFIRAGGDFLSIVSTFGESYARIDYQYREAGIGAWKTCTPAAGSTNPDTVSPFWGFFWDISDAAEFQNGLEYDVTARATTTAGVTDPSPGYVRVTVDRIDSTHYEFINVDGLIEANGRIAPDTFTELRIANRISGLHGTTLSIPAGAVTETIWIRVTLLDTTPPPDAPLSAGFIADSTGIFRRFEVHGQTGIYTFQLPLIITLPYDDGDTANDAVRQTAIQEADLAIYYYDARRQVWLPPGPSSVDPVQNVVTATTEHFTVFALLARVPAAANLANILIYPNPWIPNDGNVRTGTPYDGTPNSGVVFDNLPEQVTIEIYSIAGKLVARMQKNDAFGRYNWDARNDDNQPVASGVYLIVIKSGTGERVVKKVMIIR